MEQLVFLGAATAYLLGAVVFAAASFVVIYSAFKALEGALRFLKCLRAVQFVLIQRGRGVDFEAMVDGLRRFQKPDRGPVAEGDDK